MKVLLLYPNLMMKHILPPAIGMLSACLKQKGVETELFDTTYYITDTENPDERRKEFLQVRSYNTSDYGIRPKDTDVTEDFKKKVTEFRPDLIGVSVVEDTMKLALKLIRSLSTERPKTIFGGIYISCLEEKALEHEEIDMICIGEGEKALVELCEKIKKGEDYSRVENIYVKDRGEVIKNRLRPLAKLDELPFPDYTLFEKKRFYSPMQGRMYRMLPLDFDRGCPYACSFCAAPAYRKWYKEQCGENYFRKKNPERINEETAYLVKKYRPEYIYFNSDTFLGFGHDILEKILFNFKERVGLPFWCQTRVETVDEYKIELLKKSGCNRITIGLEHGNEEFRRKIVGKKFTNEQFIRAMDIINKAGIPVSINNIIGFPYETRELIFDTINLNRMVKSDSISVFIFYPYTGTKLHRLCVENGLIDKERANPTLLHDSIVRNENLERGHLNRLLKTFCLYVRFSKERWDEIKKVETNEPGSEEIFEKLSKKYKEKYF